jgi:Phage tail sheath C-terminal domain
MAQLNSPGVSVTVTDESFYTSNAPGTVPLIIIATAQDKQNGSGTGTAPGTTEANAGQVYLLTSQKDVSDTFGMPIFQTDAQNNPINGGELNEYGLQAAYSYLGVSNRAYVVRADVNLDSLTAQASAPTGAPTNGTYWFDSTDTQYGVFTWNSAPASVVGGQTFNNVIPTVITNSALVDQYYAPISSYGAVGQYAIVAVTSLVKLWYKKAQTYTASGIWVEVGSPTWAASIPSARGSTSPGSISSSAAFTITVNSTQYTHPGVTSLAGLVTSINTTTPAPGITAAIVNNALEIYSTGVDFSLSGANVTAVGLLQTTYKAPHYTPAPHYQVPTYKITDWSGTANGMPTGSIWVKTTNPNLGASWVINKYSASAGTWIQQAAPLYANNATALNSLDPTGGGINLALGTVYVKYNDDEGTPAFADFKIYGRSGTGATTITSSPIYSSTFASGNYSFTVSETIAGSASFTSPVTISFTATGATSDAGILASQLQAALVSTSVSVSVNSTNQIVISHTQGGDIKFVDGTGTPVATLFANSGTANFFNDPNGTSGNYVASLWTATVNGSSFAPASAIAPTSTPANGTLWYNSIVDEVDIMINNGSAWVGYKNYSANSGTDVAGPIVSATQPTIQSNGNPLQDGDLWIDTSNLTTYPVINRYSSLTQAWTTIDNSDHTTEHGIIFADARWNIDGGVSLGSASSSIVSLLTSNFLDFDAPSAALYPRGMLLWNLRRSGFNVKRYVSGYVNKFATNPNEGNASMFYYFPDRWVSEAANDTTTGAGVFGSNAQRTVVVQALQALINDNQQIRDEDSRIFNLIACPGYPEVMKEMIGLNYDRGISAFVVGDSPAQLTPDATSINNWATNVYNATNDGLSGLISTDDYLAVFYPWGYSSDSLGNNVVVPPSHMMLRTIALSDNVSYPWFAPAGTQRGGITNATSVGYVNSTGEFISVALNTGQRDTLCNNKVNPIAYISGTGLVNYGQFTRATTSSSLDRINVARLVIYLRAQLNRIAKSYIFEPNDTITRNEIKGQIESFLLELVGQRAIYDYIVVCDTTNNTPATIDANELYVDVAIEPVKAVEFIYIPLRIQNTGTIQNISAK